MKVSIIGTGCVGLTTGVCLSALGHHVLCMDTDVEKVQSLEAGLLPFYEPGLKELMDQNLHRHLKFTSDIQTAVDFASILFITVGTPSLEDGSVDLSQVLEAARSIARYMVKCSVIVDKSTVPVGTARLVKQEMMNVLQEQGKCINFEVVSNPEFLSEGNAVNDFMKPFRIVVGCEDLETTELLKALYQPLLSSEQVPFIATGLETAEMIKYACNAFLAAKISFINEMANFCEHCGADITTVSKAMGLDRRIGPLFLNPGPGYGGSCFPKDTAALVHMGKKLGCLPLMVQSSIEVNHRQIIRAVKKIRRRTGPLKNKNITLLGAAFKPGTDDVRLSPSIQIIHRLVKSKARVRVCDPMACGSLKKLYPDLDIVCCEDPYSACIGSDCIVLVTEWPEYKQLDFARIRTTVRRAVLVDLRNMYDPNEIRSFGFTYEGVGTHEG